MRLAAAQSLRIVVPEDASHGVVTATVCVIAASNFAMNAPSTAVTIALRIACMPSRTDPTSSRSICSRPIRRPRPRL